jgi:hypothetical protein
LLNRKKDSPHLTGKIDSEEGCQIPKRLALPPFRAQPAEHSATFRESDDALRNS